MDGMTDDELRNRLQEFGFTPGPIDNSTRKAYERKLEKLVANTKTKENAADSVFRKPLPRRKATHSSNSSPSTRSSPSTSLGRRNIRSPAEVARFSSDESGTDDIGASSSRSLRKPSNPRVSSPAVSQTPPPTSKRGDSSTPTSTTQSRRSRQDPISSRPTRNSIRSSALQSQTTIPAAGSTNSRPSYHLAEDQLQVSDLDDDYQSNRSVNTQPSTRRFSRRLSRKSFGANTSSFLLNSDSDDSGLIAPSSPLVEEEDDDVSPNGGLSQRTEPSEKVNENGRVERHNSDTQNGILFPEIRWKRHVPNLLLFSLIILIGIVICAYMVQKDKHDMSRRFNEYRKLLCQSDLLTSEENEEICLHKEQLQMILTVTRQLYAILSDHSGQYWCGFPHVTSPRMDVRTARQLVAQGSSPQSESISPNEWSLVLTVLLRLPQFNVRVTTDREGKNVAISPQEAVMLECTRPRMTVRCRLYYMGSQVLQFIRFMLESIIFYITTLLCLLGVILSACCIGFGIRWWIRNRNEVDMNRERAILVVVDRVRDILREQRSDSEMTQGIPSYLPIETLKDMCLTAKQRKDTLFWETVCDHIYEHESQVEIHEVPEVGEVWEWRKPTSSQPAGWQGSALPEDNGQKLPFDHAPTECLKIRNMFSLELDRRPGWKERLKRELLTKCSSAGPILHIGVETGGNEGLVYVKCLNRDVAGRAFQCIHANYFDGKLLTVKFLRDEKYCRRYPEAGYIHIPLKVEDF